MIQSLFLQTALEAAKKAEKIILDYYSDHIRVTLKKDQSPVTIADKKAEDIIKETIKKKFPDHGFLGEEFGQENQKSPYTWIIDPIDGTKNYVRQIPIFGTLLALMKDNEIILGVSNAPLIKELVYAEKGRGAFLNEKRIFVSNTKTIDKAFICYGNLRSFIYKGVEKPITTILHDAYYDRGFGDIMTYHVVASGKADAVMEADVKIWDIAPFVRIIQEAGGVVTDLTGKQITKTSTSIIASNTTLHKKLLNYFHE